MLSSMDSVFSHLPSAESMALLLSVVALAYDRRPGLDHPTRQRIYEHLLRLPGDHFRSVVRSLHLGLGTARYHLGVLGRNGFVRSEKMNGWSRYYPIGRRAEPERNRLYEKHWRMRDLRLRVLQTVRRSKEAGPSEVARTLGISRQLAAYHLDRLTELGYLKQRRSRGRPYAVR